MNRVKEQTDDEVEIVFDGLILDLSESVDETIESPADSKIEANVENVMEVECGIVEQSEPAPRPAMAETAATLRILPARAR